MLPDWAQIVAHLGTQSVGAPPAGPEEPRSLRELLWALGRLNCTAFISLKLSYHASLGLLIAFGGTTRIGLHACMLEIALIILTLFISQKTISASFKNGQICTTLL